MTKLPTVVGIGASAGGLEALQDFVHSIPNDSGLAYVIVQHLAPDQPSLMDKLLSAHTPVPVTRIEDGGTLEPDNVYIIPPGPFLEIEDGRFRLVEHEREAGVRTPIDRFFTSLSEAAGRNAFAVVLSGTGSDGTLGVRAIKSQGGIALVQESRSARFPGMPDSAAATGLVDFILRPRDMPGRILEIVRHRRYVEEDGGREELLDRIDERLGEVLDRLDEEAGNSFSGYKPGTLVRRVARRMTLLRQSSLDGYLRTLEEKDEERQLLTQDFLIGVTKFFRDPQAYDVLRDRALTPLFDGDRSSFRIWAPGCSTGEEAYSIAILVSEMAEAAGDNRSWKIFGTDIDLDALRHARTGRYSEAALEGLGEKRRKRFFIKDEDTWQVNGMLREMCVFAPHNLLSDPPFSKLDLISCRNVMIYLNAESQESLLPRFHYALNPGSYLWLGPSESLGRNERYFRTVDRSARLFRRDDRTTPTYSSLSAQRRREGPVGLGSGLGPEQQQPRPHEDDVEAQSEQLFLQRRAAPFATVNRQNEVVYVSEAMTSLVKPSRGRPSTSLDDFLAPELRLPVHSALDEARESGLDAELRNVVADVAGAPRLFDISVTPFGAESDLMLVALNEVRQRDLEAALDENIGWRGGAYEQELILTRKRLTSLEQEYETAEQELRSANEELLSMNEELQSSNEELETSREELQSINEELETINAELTENNRQLTRANSDLKNLLESTDIATLFIDENDCVRLYTPELSRLFGVQERDIGRSIHDLASKVDYDNLAADAERVRKTLQPIERELRVDSTDETFQARVRPYRTIDNRIDGVVITFVDVTTRKRNEQQLEENARVLREQYSELETLYDTAPVGLNLLDRDLRYLRINARLAEINGLPVEDHIGKLQEELLPEAHAEVSGIQRQVLETGEPALGLAVHTETPAEPGRMREFLVDYYPVRSGDEIVAIGSCVREVTKERELERQIAESEERLRRIFDQAPVLIAMHQGPEHEYVYSNPLHDEAVGHRELLGRPLREAMADLAGLGIYEKFDRVFETGGVVETEELKAELEGDGSADSRCFRQVLQPWFGPDGKVAGVMSFAFDITDLVEARRQVEESRARLQRLQNSLSIFVGMLTPDGTLIEANESAIERGGLTRGDVIGRKFWDCWWWSFSEESKERLKGAVASAARGDTVRYDVPARMAEGEMITIDFQLVPHLDAKGNVTAIVPSGVDVTERVEAQHRKDMLLAELEHRVKNILATVQSVARFTARMSKDKEHMSRNLIDRLAAISRTHDLLTASGWRAQSLRSLVQAEVAPYVDAGAWRFVYKGDDLLLEPGTVVSMGLALHELATNAAKYGAYSSEDGRVEVAAEVDGNEFQRVEWREIGGPPVAQPERNGFGTFLVQELLARELNASIKVHYDRKGLRCVIERGEETSHENQANR